VGLFVRSLVDLERAAAVEVMNDFLNDSTAAARQINFVNYIVECLTQNGAITDNLIL
jgi:type I restriction enzyme, R subunit